jgi:oleate hydratase
MHLSHGNYEAFARPRPVKGAKAKHLWCVGSGLASLSSAVFAVRDAGIPGANITILEKRGLAGGALDGIKDADKGFVMRGGREMESHFECLWDCFRSIPSLEIEGASVLDEFYWLDKDDPNSTLQRVTHQRGESVPDWRSLKLNRKARLNLLRIFLSTREAMEGKRIDEVFGRDFLDSNMWLYWRTMFAFEEWHSALEMKLYLHRFIHHYATLADFSSLKFTKYNQYESLVLPITRWLIDQGVRFQYETEVTDVDFDLAESKRATRIHWRHRGVAGGVDLKEDDLLLLTIGSLVDNADEGDHHTSARLDTGPASAWELWKRVAAKDPAFGRPDVFCGHIPQSKWESATVTTVDARIPEYIQRICKRDPFSGKVVTGGIVTVRDSSWLLSWTVNRQPHFKQQKPTEVVAWLYGLFVETPGDYVKKPLQDCTGEEIVKEWLYHLGVPVADIPELAATGARCVPCMMPYVTAFFMPRKAGDRPDVVPKGAKNFAFIGQFAETGRDCIFTTEYSVRTGMEAVYGLLGVERGIPETFGSTYDVRALLKAAAVMRDGERLSVPGPQVLEDKLREKLNGTEIGRLLEEAGLI